MISTRQVLSRRATQTAGICPAIVLLVMTFGCNSIFNAWFDPTAVGSFTREATMEIRTSLSLQDMPEGMPGATEPQPRDLIPLYDQYEVGPGDVLNIRIFELLARATETNVQATVDEVGTISIPVLGQLRVAGLSRTEIEQEIAEQLRVRGYIQEAQVIVEPVVKRRQTFVIFGATSAPNVYPIPRPDTRLLEATNIAGGLVESATEIFVMREEGEVSPETEPGFGPAALPSAATLSAGYGGSSMSASAPPSSAAAPSQTAKPATNAREQERLSKEKADLFEAVMGTQQPRSAPAKEQLTTKALEEIQEEPAQRPRWIFLNGQGWVQTTTAPAEEKPAAPVAPESQPVPPPEVEPQIDWSRLAGEKEMRVIRVSAPALRNGDYRQNIVVRAGDKIRVVAGEVGEYYIMGQVTRPGAYTLTGRRVTLKAAIAAAGNLAPLAWPTRCTVYRRYGDREEMHQVNLDAMFAGKEPDILLKNNDLVLVGTHPAAPFLAVFRNAFRMTYGFGFVYDRNFADIDSFGSQPNPAILERTGQGTRFPNLFR